MYGAINSQDVCVFTIQLKNASHKMNFNVTKGSSNDYLASVFVYDVNQTRVYNQQSLYPAQPVDLKSENDTDVFFVVLYPIS